MPQALGIASNIVIAQEGTLHTQNTTSSQAKVMSSSLEKHECSHLYMAWHGRPSEWVYMT